MEKSVFSVMDNNEDRKSGLAFYPKYGKLIITLINDIERPDALFDATMDLWVVIRY